jgi:glutathione S-transferase
MSGFNMLNIYGVPLSPFVRKVHLALAHKGIEYNAIPTMPGDSAPEFRAISPLGKIPVLQDGEFSVPDSSIILRYLDAKYPEKTLYPQDPELAAKVCWLEEYADTNLVQGCAVFFRERLVNPKMMNKPCDEDAVADAQNNLMPPLLDYLESVVQEAGYFIGDALSVADLGITSAFVNAQYGGYSVDAEAHPKLAAYLARAMQSSLVKDQLDKEQKILSSFG